MHVLCVIVMKFLQNFLENVRKSEKTNTTNLPCTNSVYYIADRTHNNVSKQLEFKNVRVTSQFVVCRSETLMVKSETKPMNLTAEANISRMTAHTYAEHTGRTEDRNSMD
jgi:hypothetical protein